MLGAKCGVPLPNGLVESSNSKKPIFAPSTKPKKNLPEENITFERMEKIVGKEKECLKG